MYFSAGVRIDSNKTATQQTDRFVFILFYRIPGYGSLRIALTHTRVRTAAAVKQNDPQSTANSPLLRCVRGS